MKKSLVIHPFLLALFPIFSIFSSNAIVLPLSAMFFPIGLMLLSTLLFFAVFYFIIRETQKAGLLTSILVFLSFFYPIFRSWMRRFVIGGIALDRDMFLMPAFGITLILILWKISRARKDLSKATHFLNIFAIILLLTSILNITYYKIEELFIPHEVTNPKALQINQDDRSRISSLPDIYYIILDNYISSRTLEKEYDYANTEFTDFLIKEGFYIAFESHCNYVSTQDSLASSLNMRYINDEINKAGRSYNKRYKVAMDLITNNIVKDHLKAMGYKFVHFGSWWGPTIYNKYADLNYQGALLSEFSQVFLYKTLFRPIAPILVAYDIRNMILYTFSNLAKMPNMEGPKFIFAHIISPHAPYVFQSDGELPMSIKSLLKVKDHALLTKDLYLGQLSFINNKVEILIREILSKSKTPPIIIIQGDHGERTRINADYTEKEYLKQKTGILNAYYLPDGGDKTLYSSITPVNTFRMIFNHYFNTDYKVLNDKLYDYDTSQNGSGLLIDITNSLK